MKISLFAHFTDLVNEKGIIEAAAEVRKCGYDGVEFLYSASAVPSKETGEEYRAALTSVGLAAPCVSFYAQIVSNHAPYSPDRNTVEGLKRGVDFTQAIGAKYLHHTVYPCMSKECVPDYNSVIKTAVEGCLEVAEYAKSRGMTVLYEPQGLVFNGKVGFVNFFREMRRHTDNVAVCFDVGNSYWVGEDPFPILRELADNVVHVHLKDYASLPDESECDDPCEVSMGNGSVNITALTKHLLAIGYDGFFSVEDATDTPIAQKHAQAAKVIG